MTRLNVVFGLELVDIFPLLCWHISFLGRFFSTQRTSCSCAHDPDATVYNRPGLYRAPRSWQDHRYALHACCSLGISCTSDILAKCSCCLVKVLRIRASRAIRARRGSCPKIGSFPEEWSCSTMPRAFTGLAPTRRECHLNAMVRVNISTSYQLLQPCEAPHLFKPGAQTHENKRTKVKVPACGQGLLQGTNCIQSEVRLPYGTADIQKQDGM